MCALLVLCGEGDEFSAYGEELEAEEVVPEVAPEA